MQNLLLRTANAWSGAEPERFLTRIKTHSWFLRLPELANPDYFSLIKHTPQEYARREHDFDEKWGFSPYWSGPVRTPIVVGREDVPFLDRGIKLFIPVTDSTTRMEINQSWSEVVKRQSYAYSKKKKHARANYGMRLKVYDLKQQEQRTSLEIAQELGPSLSGVEKVYRSAFQDVHSLKPNQARKSKKIGIYAPPSSESEEVMLKRRRHADVVLQRWPRFCTRRVYFRQR